MAIDGFQKKNGAVSTTHNPQDGEIDPKFFEDVDIKKLGNRGMAHLSKIGHSGWERFDKPLIEGSLEVKLPTIWTDEKQSRAEAERRGN